MGKALTKAQQSEYDRLRAFLAIACETALLPDLPHEALPLALVDQLYRHSPMRALHGLQEAVRDMVEAYEHTPDSGRERLEARLAEAGAPSLNVMRDRRSRDIFAVVQRGEIRSDEEWLVVSGALSDTTDRLLTGDSRELASELVARYETSKR